VVGFQLLQAGCELTAMVDAAPRVGGYGVHASKVARCGVPFFLSHTIVEVRGQDKVEEVTIGEVDSGWNIIPGTQKTFSVDTICLAVGLSPMSQLLKIAGCDMTDNPRKGGVIPLTDQYGETSVKGIYAAGDVSGIEEASSAMIGGRIAGCAAAKEAGYLTEEIFCTKYEEYENALECLRQGMFGPDMRGRADIANTAEGIMLSATLLKKGYISNQEILRYPGVKTGIHGIHPVIECSQNIPCNPCQDACVKGCITIGSNITALPVVDEAKLCSGCGMCVASCSGQAIFLVEENEAEGYSDITLPYEFLPLPIKGQSGIALDRSGAVICDAQIIKVKSSVAMDHTHLVTMRVPLEMTMQARFFKHREEGGTV